MFLVVAGATTAWLSRPARVPAPAPGSTAAAAPAAASSSRRSLVLPDIKGLQAALRAADIAADEAVEAAKLATTAIGATKEQLHAVLTVTSQPGKQASLERLDLSLADGAGAVVARGPDGAFVARKVAPSLTSTIRVVRGEMDANSFYSSAVAAGVTDSLVSDIARALAFDFNFQFEIKPGDVFEIAWEQQVNAQGREAGTPKLLFVSLTTPAKSRSLYWFRPQGSEGGWYDGNGVSTVRTLMRTPVDGARVTSNFGSRVHPVLGFVKMHKGTDFGAPVGTPIFAAGDGTVEWAAMKGPNGNLTILRHDNGWETYYLHQNAFMPGIAAGARVRQGQQIGFVGTTGRSTGPHLHYEVHVGGEPVDPMSIKTDAAKALEGAERTRFLAERDRIDVGRARGG